MLDHHLHLHLHRACGNVGPNVRDVPRGGDAECLGVEAAIARPRTVRARTGWETSGPASEPARKLKDPKQTRPFGLRPKPRCRRPFSSITSRHHRRFREDTAGGQMAAGYRGSRRALPKSGVGLATNG
jgi:hypothetical protein